MSNNKHRFIVSLLTAVAALASTDMVGANNIPRLVINILIDQLRTDYMEAFKPLYGEQGFKRLLNNGRIYEKADYDMSETDRASAAASLSTGTTPFNHGIIGNRWLDRESLRPVDCVEDRSCKGQATEIGASPQNLGVSTLSDELKVATDGKALVYSFSPFRDAAILTAGHAADGAFWIDDNTGAWCTSDYYSSLPDWVNKRDLYQPIENVIKNNVWMPSSSAVTDFNYFLSAHAKNAFKHKFNGDYRFQLFKTSGLVNDEVVGMVKDCLDNTPIGTDNTPDCLNVTLYSGNYDHLPVSEAPVELQDIYARLDKALGDLLTAVDKKVGLQNVMIVVTSTGYSDEEPTEQKKYRIPTGTFDMKRSAALLNMYLQAVYGQGRYVDACLGSQIYLNHKQIEDKQQDLTEVLNRSQNFLLQLTGVKDVYTSGRLLLGAYTPGIRRIRNNYNKKFSGDILLEIFNGWHLVNNETNEDHLARAVYVPFPIIFAGSSIKSEKVQTPVTVDCIAPTLSKAMRIRAPSASNASPLSLGNN